MLQMYTLFQNLHRCWASLPLCSLPDAASCCQLCLQLLPPAARTSSTATALRPATALSGRPSQQHRPDGTPGQQQTSSGGEEYSGLASNLAHLGRICSLAAAACDLSQHLLTYMCPSPLLPSRAAAQTDANLSAHLHRLPTPPPYLRRMRLLPGLVCRCWMQDEAVA